MPPLWRPDCRGEAGSSYEISVRKCTVSASAQAGPKAPAPSAALLSCSPPPVFFTSASRDAVSQSDAENSKRLGELRLGTGAFMVGEPLHKRSRLLDASDLPLKRTAPVEELRLRDASAHQSTLAARSVAHIAPLWDNRLRARQCVEGTSVQRVLWPRHSEP